MNIPVDVTRLNNVFSNVGPLKQHWANHIMFAGLSIKYVFFARL